MSPEIVSQAAAKSVSEATEKTAVVSEGKISTRKLAEIEGIGIGPLEINVLVENIPLAEEHARFFSAPEFRELELTDIPDVEGIRIQIGEQNFDISLAEGTILDLVGVRELINYAMDPAIEQFTKVRLEEIRANRQPDLNGLSKFEFPSPSVICCPMPQWRNLLGSLEKAAFDLLPEDMNLTAKRVDYLVDDQYVPGRIADLPILGGISNLLFKNSLGETIESSDWLRATGDTVVIVSIAVTPFLPAAGGAAIAAWAGVNAGFGAISSGLTEYSISGNQGDALEAAGKGALLGAVGGAAGGAAVAKLMPAISKPILAHTAAGATTGTAFSTTEAIIEVIDDGVNLDEAAKKIVSAALEGAAVGGGTGALGLGASKLAGKLTPSPGLSAAVNEGVEKGSLARSLERARLGPYCQGKTPGFYSRLESHVQDLGDIPGVKENLSIMAGKNLNAAKGRFTELGAAAAFKKAGHEVVAIGKIVDVPGLGKTDIDLLTGSGKWIEKKHVQSISCDQNFRTKIDKMADAVRSGMEVDVGNGEMVKIREAVFVNSKKISPNAMKYAEEKGVKVFQDTPYTRVPI